MNTESIWTKPTLERLDVAELTLTRGFGRDREEREDRRGNSRWGRGRNCNRDDS
ncbi:MAG: hypothetical protein RL173_863 [Fibrobacterota bacterium]|jgi:hypothetical protein